MNLTDKDIARFWKHVERRAADECWEWKGGRAQGYGRLGSGYGQAPWYAARVSWVIHNGEIPEDMQACHHCDNPGCVNPSHLFLGTAQDNQDDCAAKGRRPRGSQLHSAKLTEQQVETIRVTFASGHKTVLELSKEYGVTRSNISVIIHGRTWRHVGGPLTEARSSWLSEEEVKEIREKYAMGEFSMRDLGEMFDVHYSMISLIVNNKRHKRGLSGVR